MQYLWCPFHPRPTFLFSSAVFMQATFFHALSRAFRPIFLLFCCIFGIPSFYRLNFGVKWRWPPKLEIGTVFCFPNRVRFSTIFIFFLFFFYFFYFFHARDQISFLAIGCTCLALLRSHCMCTVIHESWILSCREIHLNF